jgi:serine/threonine-protein kinase
MAETGSSRTDLPTGVGRYEIRSRLAQDPLDEVYAAFDPLIERPMAVKLFSLRAIDAAGQTRVREAFAREMPRAGILTHPSIVALYDAGEWPGGLFMATELVEGEDLTALLAARTDLDLPLRVSLIVQMVDALEHARDLDVAHLHLKPSNIRVGADYMLKVGSFGVAPVVDALVVALGREPEASRYLAPERLRGEPGDFRSDSFGVAQIALDILAGVDRPMPAGGWMTPPPLPDVLVAHGVRPDRWDALFTHALSDDPDDRFQTVGAFSADLLMRLELSESEARLAWETSRAMGAFATHDPTMLGTRVGSESIGAGGAVGSPTSTTTTTTAAAAAAGLYDSVHGDSETMLGPPDRRAVGPSRRDED